MNRSFLFFLSTSLVSTLAMAMEPVIVTATRTAQTADETLAPVTVITREDIEASGAQDLTDLFRGQPGLDISTNGGYGKASNLFLRGTNSDHVLVMIDGVKLYSATLGTTAFQFLPLEQIEKIEIIRGPRASLYGSEAIGGVIQLFTRKGQKDGAFNASAGYGSDSTVEATAGLSGAMGDGGFNLQASAFDTDGIDVTDGNQLDEDGYDNRSVSLNLEQKVGETGGFDITLLRAEGTTEFDNAFDDDLVAEHESDFVQQVLQAGTRFSLMDNWMAKIQFGQTQDKSEVTRNGAPDGEFNTKRNHVSWQNDIDVSDTDLLTLGVDYNDDKIDGSVDYVEDARDNLGIFGQWQGDYGAHQLITGLRHDDNEQFGTQTTGSIDYGYIISETLRIGASFGTGFKAPSFNELYFPDFGNPELEPEESESVEVSIQGNHANGRWALRAFDTKIDNLIAIDFATFTPENIEQADIQGIEAEYTAELAGWLLGVSATYLDPQNRQMGKRLRRRAKRIAKLSATKDFNHWHVGASLISSGNRFEDDDNTIALSGYELFNTVVGYRINDHLTLQLEAKNLFDEDYQTADGFKEKGRTLFARLKYQ